MSDPLEELFRQAQSWQPPPGHVEAVRQRGRRVRRGRFAGFAAIALLIVTAGTTTTWYLADLSEREPTESALRPDEPADEMIAKVARFAFHAIFEAGPYQLDYQSTKVSDDGWVATFVSGPSVAELRRSLQFRRVTVEEFEEKYLELKQRIAAERRGGASRKVLRQLEDELQRYEYSLPLARQDVRRAMRDLQETIDSGGPHYTMLEIVENDGVFAIARLTGPYEDAQRAAIEGFVEEVPKQALGYEFFDVRTRQDAGLSWEAQAIYVGPIPSADVVKCGLELYDAGGRLVAKTPGDRRWETQAQPEEDRRDGIGGGGPLKQIVEDMPPDDELISRTNCVRVDGDWKVVGEPEVRSVEPGETQAQSSYPLDPDRHVMVEVRVQYRGEESMTEHICIAHVLDSGGVTINSHGQTIYPHEIRGSERDLLIPVDVGDPSRAVSARVECQPVIPGVPLGPDQERGPN